MKELSEGIAFLLIIFMWSACLLGGAKLMVMWLWSPFDLMNLDYKSLGLALVGAALVNLSILAVRK